MTDDTPARQLHDRATRGGILTEAERATLEAWYNQKDHEEAVLLSSTSGTSTALDALREQLAAALARLREETGRIQAQSDENEALRPEIVTLSQQLAQTKTFQTA